MEGCWVLLGVSSVVVVMVVVGGATVCMLRGSLASGCRWIRVSIEFVILADGNTFFGGYIVHMRYRLWCFDGSFSFIGFGGFFGDGWLSFHCAHISIEGEKKVTNMLLIK